MDPRRKTERARGRATACSHIAARSAARPSAAVGRWFRLVFAGSVLWLSACAVDVTSVVARDNCVSNNSKDNMCELSGVTVTGTGDNEDDDGHDGGGSGDDDGDGGSFPGGEQGGGSGEGDGNDRTTKTTRNDAETSATP